jgi:hypothetical protein
MNIALHSNCTGTLMAGATGPFISILSHPDERFNLFHSAPGLRIDYLPYGPDLNKQTRHKARSEIVTVL